MKKGFRSTFCNDDGSTSTLDQKTTMFSPYSDPHHHHHNHHQNPNTTSERSPPTKTLEDMLLKLELEEENARKAKLKDYNNIGMSMRGRMSCVNNSDILMSARNALNQYPRFSLDGKDAMYRSSFRNSNSTTEGRRSICCEYGLRRRRVLDSECSCLPSTLAGESVVWCKPGVVAKLMGLEAVPVPVNGREKKLVKATILKRRNLRKRAERHELERRLVTDSMNHTNSNGNDIDCGMFIDRERVLASSSRTSNKTAPRDYCVVNPAAVAMQHGDVRRRDGGGGGGGWPTQRFL
ncbi:hypothetical protein L484_005153 [Morus notabilis]|uniref:DUF3741 domain-containing protein n=2 Tax=Morus notabilis TaxID=981085 RepID=W9QSQ3_9ROSA|nr:hypothetical protein L484_005153 [Morus notabilis]